MNRHLSILCLLVAGLSWSARAQMADPEELKCGIPPSQGSWLGKALYLNNWGYGYDSLKKDLAVWRLNPFVKVDSVGTTVLGRTMYVMTIEDTLSPVRPRKRVWIHARTHPCEVQGTRITNEIIAILLSQTPFGKLLRDSCVFSIMPMYNIDGVEFSDSAHYRYNANMIDIESNWGKSESVTQQEVKVLRSVFTALMSKPNPIRIALNMHADYRCERFFWMHAAGGTSALYESMERQFIDLVGSVFPGHIKPAAYAVSWLTSASTVYPESWFWYNHRENVLALTYEDQNCPTNGSFDKTAYALAKGIAGFLGIESSVGIAERTGGMPAEIALAQNFPNPFNPNTNVQFSISKVQWVTLTVFDLLGREIAVLVNEEKPAGRYTVSWDSRLHSPNSGGEATGVASGVYFYTLQTGAFRETRRMILTR